MRKHSLADIPVQSSCVDLVLRLAKAHIQNRCAMFKLLQELPLPYGAVLISQIVQIHVFVP